MPSPAEYLTCLDCGHAYAKHRSDGECAEEGCLCFGYLWPDDD